MQLQNWCTSPSLLIARGGRLGSQLIASELAFFLDVLTIAKVVLNYIHQILNFLTKLKIILKNSLYSRAQVPSKIPITRGDITIELQSFIAYDRGKIFSEYNSSFLLNLSKYSFLKKN